MGPVKPWPAALRKRKGSTRMSSPEFYRTIDFFPVIDSAKCTLCMRCALECGLGVIQLDENAVDGTRRLVGRRRVCRNCRKCVRLCPSGAVSITAEMGGSDAGHLKKDLNPRRGDIQ